MKARQLTELAERYGQLLSRVIGVVDAGIAAAGEQPVMTGYRAYLDRTRTLVQQLQFQADAVGRNLEASVGVITQTDTQNTVELGGAAGALSTGTSGGH
jgi:hypothetical protein